VEITETVRLVVALCAAAITFVVSSQALAEQSTLRNHRVIGAAVSVLAFLGIMTLTDDWIRIMLIPAAALGLTSLVLWALRGWQRRAPRGGQDHSDH
jgi:hypothetical protein